MKYFSSIDVETAESLKKAFKRNCLCMHPDKGGDPSEFKAMLNEFNELKTNHEFSFADWTKEQNKKFDDWIDLKFDLDDLGIFYTDALTKSWNNMVKEGLK